MHFMNQQLLSAVSLLVVIVILAVFGTLVLSPPQVQLDLSAISSGSLGNALLSILFVALIIERATEVLTRTTGVLGRDNVAVFKAELLEEKIRTQSKAILALAQAGNESTQVLEKAQRKLETMQTALTKHLEDNSESFYLRKIRRRRAAYAVTTLLGLAAALSGFRVLEGLILTDPSDCATCDQQQSAPSVFWVTDVVLTAALLAGGSDGVHQIVSRFLKLAGGSKPGG